MPDAGDISLNAIVEGWLDAFETAIRQERNAVAGCFLKDCHWRDLLAFTWRICTFSDRETVASKLQTELGKGKIRNLRLAGARTPPQYVTRGGEETLEAFFSFDCATGPGDGILRLRPDREGVLKAWTLLTALAQITGHAEPLEETRPEGESYSRDFRGPNWLDLRKEAAAFEELDPAVLVVGCGQAGLAAAARLGQLGIDTLIVDRNDRVGDNWRNRYHALTLHNKVQVNHLPYMPFPPNWPVYIPKDKLANWFEAYAEAMELNVWTKTEFRGGSHDEAEGRWTVTVERNGETRTLKPRHIVMATGVSGIPNHPDIAGLERFGGTVLHSSRYTDGDDWAGKKAIVIGTGNSGHDIAQDLHSSGADVTLVQRSPTLIVQIEPSAQLPYTLYWSGPPTEDCDLIAASMPLALLKRTHRLVTKKACDLDRPLLDRLKAVGFKMDFGEDGTGWQFKYLTRGGGYYFNVGCSDLIADRKVRLIQFGDIETFGPPGARMKDGTAVPADLVILATGYKGQDYLVRRLFGDAVGDRVGPIWGYGDDQELRNMFVRTGQPGLWFIAGSLAQCRIYSRYLALQIKGCELGMIEP